jgi:hypothetical protein
VRVRLVLLSPAPAASGFNFSARAASQPRLSGVSDFGIGANPSRPHQAIKHNRLIAKRDARTGYQRTLALEPAVPGAKFPSSGSLSPGTGAALRELGSSVITSVGEAHPEMKKAIVKNEAVEKATRLIMGTNLIRGKFDASSGVQ